MKFKLVGAAALCGLGLGCFGFTGAQAANLANDEQKALYAIGAAISQSLGDLALSETELEIVTSGLSDGVMKRPLKVDPQAMTAQCVSGGLAHGRELRPAHGARIQPHLVERGERRLDAVRACKHDQSQ